MLTRARKLLETAPLSELEKADLYICHQGVVDASNRAKKDNTVANRREYRLAQEELEEAVRRFWPRHFPGEPLPAPQTADGDDGGIWFRTKAAAFAWYADEGGQRQKSSFYAVVPCDGKRVSRLAVSEMLRKERGKSYQVTDLSARKEEADVRRAEAEARIKERQDEEERRATDARWVLRDTADEDCCVWASRLRDATAYHLDKNLPAIIHACGGHPDRLAEVQAIVDTALAAAANEIANSGEITVDIELEDEAC